jgi:hypothetical protein
MKRYSLIAVSAAIVALAGCTKTSYETVRSGEYQIAGHPYKTAIDCERTAPVGKFDGKCDIPVVGWRGAEGMQTIVPQGGGGGASPGPF